MTQPYRGTVRNVKDRQFGSELDGDHAAGATSLTVVWTNDFNADGGQLYFEDVDGNVGEIVSYTIPKDPDDDTPSETQIDLAAALANSYVSGDKVWVYPAKVERIAYFMEPNGTEPLPARVPHQLKPLLTPGGRTDDTAEQIELEERGTQQVVLDVLAESVTGLDLQAADSETPPEEDRIRWHRLSDGAVVADIVGYDDSGLQALKLRSYQLDDVAATTGIEAYAADVSIGGILTPSVVDVQAKSGGGAANQWVRATVRDEAGGVIHKFVLRGDGTSDYLLDNAWTAWTPTLTGYSSTPTSGVYRYKQVGKTVMVAIRQPNNGTSNNVAKSISLPVMAATISGMEWRAACGAVDNGVALATPARARIASAGTVINFDKDYSATDGWTASGGHRITGLELFYEAA